MSDTYVYYITILKLRNISGWKQYFASEMETQIGSRHPTSLHLSCQNQNAFCAAVFSKFLASWPETMKTSGGYHNLDKVYFSKIEHKRKTYP